MDSEVSGRGNQYDYGFRIYNPRLGKFLSVDPLTQSYPFLTPYQFAGNMPIWAIDLDGLEALVATDFKSIEEMQENEYLTITTGEEVGAAVKSVTIVHRWWSGKGKKITVTASEGLTEGEAKRIEKMTGYWEKRKAGSKYPYHYYYKKQIRLIKALSKDKMTGSKFNKGGLIWSTTVMLEKKLVENCHYPVFSSGESQLGLSNTFNHLWGQALLATLFKKMPPELAGNMHERIDDKRTLEDVENGVEKRQDAGYIGNDKDNFVDIVNNVWGRKLGVKLRNKYSINRNTVWTNELSTNYLNDIQEYFENSLGITFQRFSMDEEFIKDFTNHINKVLGNEKSK